jgi:hypothetical protein
VVVVLRIDEVVDRHVAVLVVLVIVLAAGGWRLLLLLRLAVDPLKQGSNALLMVGVTCLGISVGVLGEAEGRGRGGGVGQGAKGESD